MGVNVPNASLMVVRLINICKIEKANPGSILRNSKLLNKTCKMEIDKLFIALNA
jgi:hypothetical protein